MRNTRDQHKVVWFWRTKTSLDYLAEVAPVIIRQQITAYNRGRGLYPYYHPLYGGQKYE
jgi:hypothetical protein